MSTDSETRKVGDRGQVVIPKRLRRERNIKGGDEIEFVTRGDDIVLRVRPSEDDLAAAYQRTAARDEEVADAFADTSTEADAYLGDAPEWE
ncbi:AbrB/MazE/SpoVT family DNA-binding domain-containing protein [Halomarina rubra]|uniref:AbrB/MazE/SpoVT family DNA-binding domain-containing protein n=1 Tax=Halomarina rubra TaxID=2071873 RepID=A0ABD6AXT5_9EURY|nr:AbrB/MazE/SpoVT family DNA-binding domain-containing protein [Halomarina rubra]